MCIQKQHTLTVDDGEKRLDILDPSGNLILTCITLEVPFGGSGGTLEERSILIRLCHWKGTSHQTLKNHLRLYLCLPFSSWPLLLSIYMLYGKGFFFELPSDYHLCFLLEIHVTQYGTLRNYEYPLLVPTKRFLIRSILLSDNSPWLWKEAIFNRPHILHVTEQLKRFSSRGTAAWWSKIVLGCYTNK